MSVIGQERPPYNNYANRLLWKQGTLLFFLPRRPSVDDRRLSSVPPVPFAPGRPFIIRPSVLARTFVTIRPT